MRPFFQWIATAMWLYLYHFEKGKKCPDLVKDKVAWGLLFSFALFPGMIILGLPGVLDFFGRNKYLFTLFIGLPLIVFSTYVHVFIVDYEKIEIDAASLNDRQIKSYCIYGGLLTVGPFVFMVGFLMYKLFEKI
jgi:hypothetical protein